MKQLTKDPVCGMNVDMGSQYKMEYKGKQYAFCCKECMQKFKENSEQLAQKADR